MSSLGPQGKHTSFNTAISSTYGAAKVDISATFKAQGMSLLNQDAAIVITFSWDGLADAGELDPADSASVTFDNFHPPNGTIYLKSASGTPRAQIHVWA